MRKTPILAVLTVLAVASSSYAVDLDNVVWFDLSGWSSISDGESNIFRNVCGDDDLTVTAIGNFLLGNSYDGSFVVAGHPFAGASHSFLFEYTGSEQLIVQSTTNDIEELVRVSFPGDEDWQLVSGSIPDVSSTGTGLQFQGIATGFGDPGVSNYVVYSDGPVSTVTWTHESLANDKYEFVRIGKVIPEPSSLALVGISLLGMMGMVRRK